MERRVMARFTVLLVAVLWMACAACDEPLHEDPGAASPPRETPSPALMAAEVTPTSTPADLPVSSTRESCPVTQPPDPPFVPPDSVKLSLGSFWYRGSFWYGSAQLWLQLKVDGTWDQLRRGDKMFFWSEGYDWRTDPMPALEVTAEQLDRSGQRVVVSETTHAFNTDIRVALLTGLTVPAGGCWEITATYRGASLRFVVWVAP